MPSRPVELVFSNSLNLYEIVVLRAFAFLVEFENSWLLFKPAVDGLKLETFGNKTLTSEIKLENMFAICLPSIPPVIFGYHADFPGAITSVARTPACMHDATGSLLWNYEACSMLVSVKNVCLGPGMAKLGPDRSLVSHGASSSKLRLVRCMLGIRGSCGVTSHQNGWSSCAVSGVSDPPEETWINMVEIVRIISNSFILIYIYIYIDFTSCMRESCKSRVACSV